MMDSRPAGLFLTTALAATAIGAALTVKGRAQKVTSPIFPGIPYAPGANWVLGHLIMLDGNGNFAKGYHDVYEKYADPKSGLCSFWFLTSPTMSVLLSSHAKAVLSGGSLREHVFLMENHMNNFLGPKALTMLNGEEWRLYRSAVHKSFTPTALKQAQASINQVGKTLVNTLIAAIEQSESKSLKQKVLPLMKMATMDVFGFAAMGTDFQCCQQLKLTKVAFAFEHLSKDQTRRLETPWDPASWIYSIPTAANREQRRQRGVIRNFIAGQIAKTRYQISAQEEVANSKHNLLANILRAANAEDGEGAKMSDEDIGDIIMILLFGGYDTTSITLTYALYMLAKHPAMQAECLKEIQSVLPTDESVETLEDPEQLQYTRAIVLETLRLYPPAPVTTRTLEKTMELSGHVLERGTNVFVPIWSVQRDARNFPLPTEMKPERWVRRAAAGGWEERPGDDMESSAEVPPANKDAFCVFAAGARNCVGRKLAMLEAATLLTVLVRKLKFQLVDKDYEVKPMLATIVQQPEDGLPMRISRR